MVAHWVHSQVTDIETILVGVSVRILCCTVFRLFKGSDIWDGCFCYLLSCIGQAAPMKSIAVYDLVQLSVVWDIIVKDSVV